MSNITKSGIILCNEFDESNAMDIISARGTMSYVPAKDTSNSCLNPANIIFDYDTDITSSTLFRIIATVSWSGFDSSSTAGTFSIYWQGSNHVISSAAWAWEGTNYVTNALNSYQSLTTLVLSSNTGAFTYDTTFSLPDSWRTTYNGSNIGFRSNYSNGVGRITVNNIIIINNKYSSTSATKAHIGNDFIAGRELIEI